MSEQGLLALGLGLLSAFGLLIGALLSYVTHWPRRLVAVVMAFGSGALVAAVAFELVAEAQEKAGFDPMAVGFLAGALTFVFANEAINSRGGFIRKPATLYRFIRELRLRRARTVIARLSQVSLLRSLPPEEIHGLLPLVRAHPYSAGDVIFTQGSPGNALYVVDEGAVRLVGEANSQTPSVPAGVPEESSPPGEPPTARLYGPGEIFGEESLLDDHAYHATAVAESNVSLWSINRPGLATLVDHSPHLAVALAKMRARLSPAGEGPYHDALPSQEDWHDTAVRHLDHSPAATAVLSVHEERGQVQAHAGEGASLAIFMGALLDGIPESVVVGASLIGHARLDLVLVIAIFVSNLPEALASAVGMRRHGYRPRFVLGLWAGLVVASGLAAFLGNALLSDAPPRLIAGIQGLAAGGILAMLADTMMPEALEQGGPFVALWTALGFLAAVFLGTFHG